MSNRSKYDEIIQEMHPGVERATLRVMSQHVGADHMIGRATLMESLSLLGFGKDLEPITFDRKVRVAISALRKAGHLICSSTGGLAGYYLASRREEYEDIAAAEYRAKIGDMAATLAAMDSAAARMFGQQAPAGQDRLL